MLLLFFVYTPEGWCFCFLLTLLSQTIKCIGTKLSPPPKLYPAFERCRRCLPLHVQLLQETSRRFLVFLFPFLVPKTAVSQSLFRRLSDVFRSRSPRISSYHLFIIPHAMVRQLWHLDDSEGGKAFDLRMGWHIRNGMKLLKIGRFFCR